MTSPITRTVTIRAGDTLRLIALRELGDPLRWVDIANLNTLRPPYIVASIDPADRLPATLVWGDRLLVPRVAALPASIAFSEDLYGIDIDLSRGGISANSAGDWSTLPGGDNLLAALARRIDTPTGELLAHPRYGCDVGAVLGFKLRPVATLLAAGFVREALEADPRVEKVENLSGQHDGDTARFGATIKAVREAQSITLNLVFPIEP